LKTKYTAILFDVGGTLIYANPSIGDIYAKEAQKFGININGSDAYKSFMKAWDEVRNFWNQPLYYGSNECDAKNFWYRVVYECFISYTSDQVIDSIFNNLFNHFAKAKSWNVYSDVYKILSYLKEKGYILGIVSNWDYRLSNILDGLYLTPYFNSIIISYAVGVEKPNSGIFKIALDRIKQEANNVLYIGNSYNEDYIPSQNIGIDCLLLKRDTPSNNKDKTNCISSLDEVIKFLEFH